MLSQQLKKLSKIELDNNFLNRIPEEPGIYVFWSSIGESIYVGKSVNLKKRITSYFRGKLFPKTAQMVQEAKHLSFIRVTSEIEALLLEARVVRTTQPKYNIELKDDKHPLYIKITKEKYPQVLTARRTDLEKSKNIAVFGPFTSSTSVKLVLKSLRKIFPFAQHRPGKKACIYSQIGLCKPCPSEIEKTKNLELRTKKEKEYRKNISLIKRVLLGNLRKVKKILIREMETLSKEEKYEKASVVKEQLQRLDYITKPPSKYLAFLENPNLVEDVRRIEEESLKKMLRKYIPLGKDLKRIECFDVAHLAGSNPTASMVTFIDGAPDKNLYRHFKIEKKRGGDDIASLKEVAERRLKHFMDPPTHDASARQGWGMPDLFLVDGGKPQVAIFWGVLRGYQIPIVGLAKRFETLVIPQKVQRKLKFVEVRVPKGPVLNLLQRIRDEAHRFARLYHHKLVSKQLIKK